MLTRNKKLKDYGIPAEDIEKLNTMLKDFPAEYGYLLTSAALSACPKDISRWTRKTFTDTGARPSLYCMRE